MPRKESREGSADAKGKGDDTFCGARSDADSVIGIDLYNQSTTGTVSKPLNAIASDSDHVPCVVIWNGKADGAEGDGVAFAIVGDHENRPTDMTNILVYDPSRRHSYECIGEVCITVTQNFGTGGGNTPIVLQNENEDILQQDKA